MGMGFWSEAKEHREATEHLHDTAWWQGLMNDPHFANSFQRNYDVRLKLSSTAYIRKLMNSEMERRAFIEEVLHPNPEHLANPDQD
ncbi:hypothetical protein EV586_101435 [Tumebacillus sp. BK434]|uniref:hypothetical protein n=1 Tax=Tumebacillus sp. BK434 TaxID=2512169 RepID=UPI001046F172|nr:hypothetical protein [Tumebacillus sp. BK434]TCP59219.1 hypothetical protein EV586_101435 [Tumebacillus sp. BK434]